MLVLSPVGRWHSEQSNDPKDLEMKESTREKFSHVSVATIATALFKRGLRHQVIQGVRPVGWKGRNMVGPAFTLRYMPAREDRNGIEVFRDPQHKQRVAIETCPEGHVLVMDSRKQADAASAGDILITRLMKRGAAGVVTDGGFRDAMNIASLELPAYHTRPSSPTNLTNNEAIAINEPIGCGDAPVFPSDVIVGDADCVIVVPAGIADEIADECIDMTAFEDFVVERVGEGNTIIGLYPCTKEENRKDFEAWLAARDDTYFHRRVKQDAS
jgi:regulator of RNase E activity RraA